MYRIGIFGSENSHALAFTRIYNLSGQYPDMQVVGIAGEDLEASEKVFQEGKLTFIAQSPQDFIGRVDAMMITSRHGGLHAGYAKPFIEQGMPVFVDKPVTDRRETAQDMLALANRRRTPIMGGSSTRLVEDTLQLRQAAQAAAAQDELLGGHIWAPVSMDNPYGGFCFYASHLVEIALTVFGYQPVAVRAVQTSTGITALLEYAQSAVALSFTNESYKYGGTVLTKQGPISNEIDISAGYGLEAAHFAEMVRTGRMPQPLNEMLMPVAVINALEQAFTSGQRIEIQAADFSI